MTYNDLALTDRRYVIKVAKKVTLLSYFCQNGKTERLYIALHAYGEQLAC